MPAPKGNRNAHRGAAWRLALKRALARATEKDFRAGLDVVANKVVSQAPEGSQWAVMEIANRLDGRPAQAVTVSGDENAPLQIRNIIEFVGVDTDDNQRVIDVTPEPLLAESTAVDKDYER